MPSETFTNTEQTSPKAETRRLSLLDSLLIQVDHALRTVAVDKPPHDRLSPAKKESETGFGQR